MRCVCGSNALIHIGGKTYCAGCYTTGVRDGERVQKLLRGSVVGVRERLAELEHEQWVKWATTLMAACDVGEPRRERWERLCKTPYELLTEKEKDQDRVWADKILKVLSDG